MVCEISPGRLRHCSNMSRTSAVHRSAAEGHPRPPSFLSRSIGDPSDPFGRDHTCLYAVIQDRVMLSSSVVDQSTIKALYRKTEQIPVTIICSFSGRESVLSSFNEANLCPITFRTCSFSAVKSPSIVIRTPRCLCGSSGLRTVKGFPWRVILSVAIGRPVRLSTPTISDLLVCTS